MSDEISILVVDDNQVNLKLICALFKDKAYNIALALNGQEALKILKDTPIDIVLMDVMMPGIDGFEVCRQLKESDETKDIPVIFLTARSSVEDILKGFEMGGVDYVTKPFIREELLARIHTHVQLKQTRDLLKKYAEDYKESRNQVMTLMWELALLYEERKQ